MQISVGGTDKNKLIAVQAGDNLLSILREVDLAIPAPCGGKGICGKCIVQIEGIGDVWSCQTRLDHSLWQKAGLTPDQPLKIVLGQYEKPQIATRGLLPPLLLSPLVARMTVPVPRPDLADQRSLEQRVSEAFDLAVPFHLLAELPFVLDASDYHPTVYYRIDNREILRFVTPDLPQPLGLAFDIGTTTLAGYLTDLKTGRLVAQGAKINPQQSYGADVISRIEQAIAEGNGSLRRVLNQALHSLTLDLINQADLGHLTDPFAAIGQVVFAGNTVMMHILADLPTADLARTPFIPVSVSARTVPASTLDLPFKPDTICQLLPSMAAYVGADITAGLIVCGMHKTKQSKTAMLIDIGTNGEMVIAARGQLMACSTAAGPAFEAANIACGLGGVAGAIDRVWADDGDLDWSVIGQKRPERASGICGSGLVSAVATFLELGLVDYTGRIAEKEDLPPLLTGRVRDLNGQRVIVIAENGTGGHPIYLSQRDIRELQNAKAAIAAGVLLLLEKAQIRAQEVDTVYLAGGFGNYLDIDDALAIGLLPEDFAGNIESVGNTAGMGALACLLEQAWFSEATAVAQRVVYFELSAEKRFSDLYIDAMIFPED